jgi:hypothetical protein
MDLDLELYKEGQKEEKEKSAKIAEANAVEEADKKRRNERRAEREPKPDPKPDPCKDATIASLTQEKLSKIKVVGVATTAAMAYTAYSDAKINLLKDKCGNEPPTDNQKEREKYTACKTELSKDTISYTTNIAQQILRDYGKPIDFGGVIGEEAGWGVRVTSEGISVGFMKTHVEKDTSGKDITSRSGVAAGYSVEQETFGMIVENPFGNTMGQFLDGASLSVLGRTGFHHLSDNSFDNLSDNYIDDANGSATQSLQAQSTSLNFSGQLAANLKTKLGEFGIAGSGQLVGAVAGQAAEYASGATMKNVAAIFQITAETLNVYTEQKKAERDIIETIELTDNEKLQKVEKLRVDNEFLQEIASIGDFKRQREAQIEGIRALIHGSLENALEAVSVYAIKKKLDDAKKKLENEVARTAALNDLHKLQREESELEDEIFECNSQMYTNPTISVKEAREKCNKLTEKNMKLLEEKRKEIEAAKAKEAAISIKIAPPTKTEEPTKKPVKKLPPTEEEVTEMQNKQKAILELEKKRKEKDTLENELQEKDLSEEKRAELTAKLSAVSIEETKAKEKASVGTVPEVVAVLDAEYEYNKSVEKLQQIKKDKYKYGAAQLSKEEIDQIDLTVANAEKDVKEKKIEQYTKENALRRSKPAEASVLLLEEKQKILNAKVSEAKEKLEENNKRGFTLEIKVDEGIVKNTVKELLKTAGEVYQIDKFQPAINTVSQGLQGVSQSASQGLESASQSASQGLQSASQGLQSASQGLQDLADRAKSALQPAMDKLSEKEQVLAAQAKSALQTTMDTLSGKVQALAAQAKDTAIMQAMTNLSQEVQVLAAQAKAASQPTIDTLSGKIPQMDRVYEQLQQKILDIAEKADSASRSRSPGPSLPPLVREPVAKLTLQGVASTLVEVGSMGFLKTEDSLLKEELEKAKREADLNEMTIKLNSASMSDRLQYIASDTVRDKLRLAEENAFRKGAQQALGHIVMAATLPMSISLSIGVEVASRVGGEALSGHVDEKTGESLAEMYSMLGYNPKSTPEQIAEVALSIAAQARTLKNIETLEEVAEEVSTDFKSGIPILVEGHSYLKFLNENWSKWKYFLPRYYPPTLLEDVPIVVNDIITAMPSQIYAQKTPSEKAMGAAFTIVENITTPEKMISRALQGVFGADIYENLVTWLQKKYLYQQYLTAHKKQILNGKNSSSSFERAWACKEEELKELIYLNEDLYKNKYIKNYALHSIEDSEIETYFSLIEKETKEKLFESELYEYYNGDRISKIYDSSKTDRIKINYKCALQLEKINTELTTLNRDEIRNERNKSIRQLIANYNPFTIDIIREKEQLLDIYLSQMNNGEQAKLNELVKSDTIDQILKIYEMDDEDKTFILETVLDNDDITLANSLDMGTREKILELDEGAIEFYYELSEEDIKSIKEFNGRITTRLQSIIFKSLGVNEDQFFEILTERELDEIETYKKTVESIKKIIRVYEETIVPILTTRYGAFSNNSELKELPIKLVKLVTNYQKLISILSTILDRGENDLDTLSNLDTIKSTYEKILGTLRKYTEEYMIIFSKLGLEHPVEDEIKFIKSIKTLYGARNKTDKLTDEEKLLLDIEIKYNLSQLTSTRLPLLVIKKQFEKKTAIKKLKKNHTAKDNLEKEELREKLSGIKKQIKAYTNYFISKKEQAETFETVSNRNARMLNERRVNSMMILYDQLVELNNSQSYFGVEDPKFADEFETKIVNLCKYLKDSTININGENIAYNEYKDEFDAFRYYHENKNARLRAFVNKYQIGDTYLDDEKEYNETQIKIEEFKLNIYKLEEDVLCYYTRHMSDECNDVEQQPTVYSMKTVLLTLYAYLHNMIKAPTTMRNFKDTCRTKTLDINIQLSTGIDLTKLVDSVIPQSLTGFTKEEQAAANKKQDREGAEERVKREAMTEKERHNYDDDKEEEAYQKLKADKERRNRIAKGIQTKEDEEYMKKQMKGEKKVGTFAKINPSISYKTSMAIYPPAGTLIHHNPTLSAKQENEKKKRLQDAERVATREAISTINKLAEPDEGEKEQEVVEAETVPKVVEAETEVKSLKRISNAQKQMAKVSTCNIPDGMNTSAPLNNIQYPSRYFDKKAAYLEHVKESSFKGTTIDGLMGVLTDCENRSIDKDWCEPPKKILNTNKLVDRFNSEKFAEDNLITEVIKDAEVQPEERNEIIPQFKIQKELYDKLEKIYTAVKNDPSQLAIQQEMYTWFMWRYSQLWRLPIEDSKYSDRKITYTQDGTTTSININTLRNEYNSSLSMHNYLEYMIKDAYKKKIQATKNLWKLMYALRMTSYQNIINRSNRGNQEMKKIDEELQDITESINYITILIPKEVKEKGTIASILNVGSTLLSSTLSFVQTAGIFIILGAAAAFAVTALGPTLALSATTVSIYTTTIGIVTVAVTGAQEYQIQQDKQFEAVRTLMIKEIEQDTSITVTKLNKLLQLQRSINLLDVSFSDKNRKYIERIQETIILVNNLESSAFEQDTINKNLNTKKDALETTLVDKDVYLKQTINNFQTHLLLIFKEEEVNEIHKEILKIIDGPKLPPIKEGDKVKLKTKKGEVKGAGWISKGTPFTAEDYYKEYGFLASDLLISDDNKEVLFFTTGTVSSVEKRGDHKETPCDDGDNCITYIRGSTYYDFYKIDFINKENKHEFKTYREDDVELEITHEVFEDKKTNCHNCIKTIETTIERLIKLAKIPNTGEGQIDFINKCNSYLRTIQSEYDLSVDKMEEFKNIHKEVSKQGKLTETAKNKLENYILTQNIPLNKDVLVPLGAGLEELVRILGILKTERQTRRDTLQGTLQSSKVTIETTLINNLNKADTFSKMAVDKLHYKIKYNTESIEKNNETEVNDFLEFLNTSVYEQNTPSEELVEANTKLQSVMIAEECVKSELEANAIASNLIELTTAKKEAIVRAEVGLRQAENNLQSEATKILSCAIKLNNMSISGVFMWAVKSIGNIKSMPVPSSLKKLLDNQHAKKLFEAGSGIFESFKANKDVVEGSVRTLGCYAEDVKKTNPFLYKNLSNVAEFAKKKMEIVSGVTGKNGIYTQFRENMIFKEGSAAQAATTVLLQADSLVDKITYKKGESRNDKLIKARNEYRDVMVSLKNEEELLDLLRKVALDKRRKEIELENVNSKSIFNSFTTLEIVNMMTGHSLEIIPFESGEEEFVLDNVFDELMNSTIYPPYLKALGRYSVLLKKDDNEKDIANVKLEQEEIPIELIFLANNLNGAATIAKCERLYLDKVKEFVHKKHKEYIDGCDSLGDLNIIANKKDYIDKEILNKEKKIVSDIKEGNFGENNQYDSKALIKRVIVKLENDMINADKQYNKILSQFASNKDKLELNIFLLSNIDTGYFSSVDSDIIIKPLREEMISAVQGFASGVFNVISEGMSKAVEAVQMSVK